MTGAGDGGLIGGPCTPGTELDLAFVDEVAVGGDVPNVLVLVGMAVVVNPGPDAVFLPAMAVRSTDAPASVGAMFQLEAPGGGVEMAPDQAKGSLDVSASALVARTFSESWVDTVTPVLTGSFALPADWSGGEVVVALEIGGYLFEIEIDLVGDAAVQLTPVATSANRVTAHCDE